MIEAQRKSGNSKGWREHLSFVQYPPFCYTIKRRGRGIVTGRSVLLRLLLSTFIFILSLSLSSLADDSLGKSDNIGNEGGIRIDGNRFFESQKLLSAMKLKGAADIDLLERNIERVLELYEENGFPYCQISPSDFRVAEEGKLTFSLKVNEGPRVKITDIRLEGLKTTKQKVILRELGQNLSGYFSQSRLQGSLRRIQRLSYIQEVKETQLLSGENPDEAILKIALAERRNNSFSGIIGYAPSTGSRKGNLVGSLNLTFDNMFGTGRRMEWSWSRKDPYSSRFDFLYQEAWIFGLPPTLELKTGQQDYDSTYLQLSFSAKLIFGSAEKISWAIAGGWEKTIPGSAGNRYLPSSRRYKGGGGFTLDLLDQPVNPRKGIFYRIEMNYSQKRNYPTTVFVPDQLKTQSADYSLDLENYLPTLKNQVIFAGVHFKELNSSEKAIPYTDEYKLGGIKSLRGYREEEFSGSTIAWTNMEYRFLLDGNSRFFLFTDFGYFERKVLSDDGTAYRRISGQKLGYGAGLRIDSKAGLLGLDYGLGQKDSFSQGKIHFGIINRF